MENDHIHFMKLALAEARKNIQELKGGPFGAIVVKDGKIIASGNNNVAANNDPTAHAEVVAIRKSCQVLGSFQLSGCTIYTSCEPCPMCLGAIYWARPDAVYYAGSKEDAAGAGFDDAFIYEELAKEPEIRRIEMKQLMHEDAIRIFEEWKQLGEKPVY